LSSFADLFIILQFCSGVKRSVPDWKVFLLNRCFFINIRSYLTLRKMKRLLLALSLFFAIPVSASEITSKIVDSVQLTVQGAAVQSTRIGASYGVSGTNITSTSFGGTAGAGTYDINTAGQAFSFSETFNAADSVVTSQTAASGTIAAPNLYSNATTQLGGDKGTLAGTLSAYIEFLPSLLVVLARLLLLREQSN
jgi:hypothetical protein